MIKFENTEAYGFEHAIRGMRNPFDSWDKSDSRWKDNLFVIGPEDKELCHKLNKGGSPHNKFLRQIICWVDITASLTIHKQLDTYRFGVEKNACSTMHTIMKKPFSLQDFDGGVWPETVEKLNECRTRYLNISNERAKQETWRELIDNLPASYLQKRSFMMSYQAIREICRQRKGHRLTEWHEFIDWARRLPNAWLLFDDLYIDPEDLDDNEPWETKAAIAAGR